MRRFVLFSFLAFISCYSFGQTLVQRNQMTPIGNRLTSLKDKLEVSQKERKALAVEYASKNGLTKGKIYRDNKVIEIQKLSADNTPLYYTTYNLNAAKSSSADVLWTGGRLGLDLNGESMTLGAWDGSAVRTSHQEFGDRVTLMDGIRFNNSNSGTEHATHVAGTLIASGVSSTAKGMAPKANLRASDWNLDESEMAAFGAAGFLISNHSYGFCTDPESAVFGGCEWPSWRFGYYDEVAASWDEIAYEAPYYLIVKASGNDLNDGKNTSRRGYDLLEGAGTSKNVLVVGAVEDVINYKSPSSIDLASFSSTGPTDDGRIKPDIVGNGVDVRSSFSGSNNDYETISGTSMATPNVSGSMILLQQHHNNLNGAFMKSSTLRGLVIHTAKEAGTNPGPDYRYGWGLIDAEKAANVISNNTESTLIEEHTLKNGESFQKIIEADGISPLVVTVCWTDPQGIPLSENSLSENSTSRRLINDLDTRLTNTNESFSPWTLDPTNLFAAAQTGDNSRDNVEKIEIENPSFGEYVITIDHKSSLFSGSQNFSIIVSGVVPSSCNSDIPGNFAANDITDQSAILSWNPLLGVNNYSGRYTEQGSSEWNAFASITNFFTLDNLLAGTVYEVEMQSLCSVADISGFSEPFTFQTDCRPDIPENIIFSNITTSSIQFKWDTVRAIEEYEVRYRASGGTWQTDASTISQITLSSLSSGETYEFQMSSKCVAETTTPFSQSVEFTPYCIASGEDARNEWIETIQFGSINNQSGNNEGYGDYSGLSTVLQRDSQIEIGLQGGQLSYFPKFWTVWIDFNKNGFFTDQGEEVMSSPVDGDDLTIHNFDIPSNALTGTTLLRITMKYNETSESCELYEFGETEDYTIDIQDNIDSQNFFTIIGQSVSNQSAIDDFSIYPNPSSKEISLNLAPEFTGNNISVMDMSGHVVLEIPFENRKIIDISSLKQGVYLVRVESNAGPQIVRFIKN
jgi:subtilisin family serine protease